MSYKETRTQADIDYDLLFFKLAGLTPKEQEEYYRIKDSQPKPPVQGFLHYFDITGQEESLLALKAFAEANPIATEYLEAMEKGEKPPFGNMPEHHRFVDNLTKVVFTIEKQGEKLVRHLSISVNKQLWLPFPQDVINLALWLGFEIDKYIQKATDQVSPGFRVVHFLQII